MMTLWKKYLGQNHENKRHTQIDGFGLIFKFMKKQVD